MGRRNYSRSPTRHNDERHSPRDYDSAHSREQASRRAYGQRSDNRSADRRNEHDYSGMYDDGQPYSRQQGDDGYYNDGYDGYDDRRERGYSSNRPRRRSRSPRPPHEAGRPSDTVILEGLPSCLLANELRDFLLNNSAAAEYNSIDVRLSSSRGNRRAFVQFNQVDQAVGFVEEHFPKLLIELQQPTDEVPEGHFDVYLHFARGREDADMRTNTSSTWTCHSCDFANFSTRQVCKVCGAEEPASNWGESLTGIPDAAEAPSQILVVYPLPTFINEEMLANDLKKLELDCPDPSKYVSKGGPKLKSTAPSDNPSGYGARPDSLHRVFLMRDVRSNASFKYGFVEFWTLEDATAEVQKATVARSFTVANCAVTVAYTHMGVFLPVDQDPTPANEHLSFNPLFNPSLRVQYRDHHVYPCQKVVNKEPPRAKDKDKQQGDEAEDGKKLKKRKADTALPASAAKKPVSLGGHLARWQKKHDEIHAGAQNGSGSSQISNRDEPTKSSGQGPIKISLSGATSLGLDTGAAATTDPTATTLGEPEQDVQNLSNDDKATVSYVDRDRLMCLICMRKYKSIDEVNIHEKSRNHKTSTENDDLVKAALPRLAVRDKRMRQQKTTDGQTATEGESETGALYRDRAKERRAVFQQPKKPTIQSSNNATTSTKKPDEVKVEAPKAAPGPSKGAGMLAKMGWTTGAGLGANGDGRTEAIATNAYQAGVGLGAQGSNLGDAAQLAEKKTTGSYSEYVSTVQDKARERYNTMG